MTATLNRGPIAIPDTVPTAPISAWEQASWRDVPKGFYAIPIWDWVKFGDDCGLPGDPDPVLELLGFQLFERKVPRVFKTGKKAGQAEGADELKVGSRVVARGVTEYVLWAGSDSETRYTPWERLKQECESDRFGASHEYRPDGGPEPACRCIAFCDRGRNSDGRNRDGRWKAAPNRLEAYINCAAACILDGIDKHDDVYRKLYGQLTGNCGCCGRMLTDPTSKLLGIGPDCRGYR